MGKPYAPCNAEHTNHAEHTNLRAPQFCGEGGYGPGPVSREEEHDRRRKKMRATRPVAFAAEHLAGDGDDTAGHDVPSEGEAWTSPETGTTRLAAASPVEVRP